MSGVNEQAAVLSAALKRITALERAISRQHPDIHVHDSNLDLAAGDLTTSGFVDVGGNILIDSEGPTAPLADTFTGDTYKRRIDFAASPSSNDPGAIIHETSDTETNEGVLHLMPSDDNSPDDYVSIHGSNDPDTIRLHTDGAVDGISTLAAKSVSLSDGSSHIQLLSNIHSQAQLQSDTATGRPYLSWYNRDNADNLDRKGYIGYPEATSSQSNIHLVSEQGQLRLSAASTIELLDNTKVTGTTTLNGQVSGTGVQDASAVPAGNDIIKANSSGNIIGKHISITSGAQDKTPTRIFCSDSNYVYYQTLANFRKNVSSHVRHCDISRQYDATANAGNTTDTLATTVGGVTVSGATAMFGTVSVVDTGTAGYVTIFRYALGSAPTGAQVNHGGVTNSVHNGFFMVDLDTSRRYKIKRQANARVIIDVQGFVFGQT